MEQATNETNETESQAQSQDDGLDFDLELPDLTGPDEPQPTMVFDASSLEQAVSDAFGPAESALPTTAEPSDGPKDITDDFFDEPTDVPDFDLPSALSEGGEVADGVATRQLGGSDLSSSAGLDLDEPTMMLPSRQESTPEPESEPAQNESGGIATKVLESASVDTSLDAVDLLDDLFNEEPSAQSGASLPAADALPSAMSESSGFDLTDDIFGEADASPASEDSADVGESIGDDSGLAALDFDDLVNQPLGSDDVSFSFDEISSVGSTDSSSGSNQYDAPSGPGATEILNEPSAPSVASPSEGGEPVEPPSKTHTWLGLGMVATAVALIAANIDFATILDDNLSLGTSGPISTKVKSDKATPTTPKSQAAKSTDLSSDKRSLESVTDVFKQDYAGLVRAVESASTLAEIRALSQYRLGTFFGETDMLAAALKWRAETTLDSKASRAALLASVAIGASTSATAQSAQDAAELELAKDVKFEPFERALIAAALGGTKQRPDSLAMFKELLEKDPSAVEIWQLMLGLHQDRATLDWSFKKLQAHAASFEDEWSQGRLLRLLRRAGNPGLAVSTILESTVSKSLALESFSRIDQSAILELRGLRGVLKGTLDAWKTFVVTRHDAQPDLEHFIERERVTSLVAGTLSNVLIDRARAEKAPLVQGRLYYEVAVLGRDLALEKETSELVQEMVKGVSPTKSGGYFQLARGELALLMGNRTMARRFISAALRVNPRLTDASLASLMLLDRDKDAFLRQLTKLHQRKDSARVAWQLARVFSERNNHGGALKLIERLLVEAPTVAPVSTLLFSLLDNLIAQGDYVRMTRLAESLHAANPKDSELIGLVVDALGASASRSFPDRLSESVKWTERLHRLDPANRENLYSWVEAMLNAEKRRDARDVLKGLLDEYPDARGTAKFTQLLARTWIGENPSEARQFLKESIRLERMAQSHILLAELEERRQSQTDAIEQYLKAIELEPTLVEVRFRVGRLLHEVGRYPEASRQLEVVVNTSPANSVARELLGDTYRDQGVAEKALRQYLTVINQGNAREALLMKTARLQMYDLNRLEDAVRSLEQAARLNDKNSEIRYLLGVALKDLNQLERARRQFQRYLRLDPDGDYAEEIRGILKNL